MATEFFFKQALERNLSCIKGYEIHMVAYQRHVNEVLEIYLIKMGLQLLEDNLLHIIFFI